LSCLLFAYGTLMPADSATAQRDGWSADAVRGRLFDLGAYPALVDLGDPSAGWVEGFVRQTDEAELDGPLDRYEAVDTGPYRRAVATSRTGRQVHVYEYTGPLPPEARGPILQWRAPLQSDRS
jgi:gamma-glutamylcyclotransferase (GGCT)/AIG2-like uncharacterized protein YtfP